MIVGVDPGLQGALAFIDAEKQQLRIFDMPIFEWQTVKTRKKPDIYAIVNLLEEFPPEHIYMEEVWTSPQMGVVSAGSFMLGRGLMEGVAAGLRIPMTQTKPAQWKKAMRVPADKRAATQRACQLLPSASKAFYGPRGGLLDGRAEAALMALYGCMDLNIKVTPKMEFLR